ncbi:AAA family ATPase [Nonomuraea antimicrobica]
MALTSTVSIITGGPGCGKSHTVKAIATAVRAGAARWRSPPPPARRPSGCPS